jgi:putative tricarboxylic transport membrane protein
MKIPRRRFLRLSAGVAILPCAAYTQDPTPLLILVPGPQGGGFDRAARSIGTVLQQAGLVSELAYENVGAAGGVTALPRLAELSDQRPSVLMVTGAVMVGAFVARGASGLLTKTTPIARLAVEPLVIAVDPAGPADFPALAAKLRGSGEAIAAGGPNGSPDHLLLRALIDVLDIRADQIIYRPHAGGRPAAETVLAGDAAFVLTNWSDLAPFVGNRQLRALAITDAPPGVPSIAPALRDLGIPLALGNWRGVLAGAAIGAAERRRLVELIAALSRSSQWQRNLVQRGWIDAFLAETDFEQFLAEEINKVRAALSSLR